jgi:hypothetical protein
MDPKAMIADLIAALSGGSRAIRQAAASELAELYRSGRLDDADKRLILEQRKKMAAVHQDRQYVDSYCRREVETGWYHVDNRGHVDYGIGIRLDEDE